MRVIHEMQMNKYFDFIFIQIIKNNNKFYYYYFNKVNLNDYYQNLHLIQII